MKMGASWHKHSGYWAKRRGQKRFLKWALKRGCTIQPLSPSYSNAVVVPLVSPSSSDVTDELLEAAESKVRESMHRSDSPRFRCIRQTATYVEDNEIAQSEFCYQAAAQ